MPDNLSKEEDAAAASGVRPSETGPGATGGSAIGGDSIKEEGKAVARPKMSPKDAGKDKLGGDAPTGGLGGVSSVGGG